MKKEYLELAGKWFEVSKAQDGIEVPSTYSGCNRDMIDEVYTKPSVTKREIWSDWCDWCDRMNAVGNETGISILGHNCNFFSISGVAIIDGETYGIWITYAHNRLVKY